MLRRHIVLLIAIRLSDGDVKTWQPPWCFSRRAGYEPAPGFTFSLPFIIIPHNTIERGQCISGLSLNVDFDAIFLVYRYSTLISSILFHIISPCDGASGVVGRHPCYSLTYNLGASSHLIPRPDLVLDTS